MQEKKNIDDLLMQVDLTPDSLQDETPAATEPENNERQEDNNDANESTPDYGLNESNSSDDSEEESTFDDYGQKTNKKEKLYTQAEVEQMMRDRNKRGEFAKKEDSSHEEPRNDGHNDDESEGWEEQFETLVDKSITKREKKIQEQQWKQRAEQEQAEFEIKFNTGAAKYSDFESVVIGKPITAQMAMATKAMKDPAAFIYAAAKTQAHELDRISKIVDPLVQAVEIGKLEERMRKGRVSNTAAPKPMDGVKGDVAHDKVKPRSVDDILREEANKQMRGRR